MDGSFEADGLAVFRTFKGDLLGRDDGFELGFLFIIPVGFAVGRAFGLAFVGLELGLLLGFLVGLLVGLELGFLLGLVTGFVDGGDDGFFVGTRLMLGELVGFDCETGLSDGLIVGFRFRTDGLMVGLRFSAVVGFEVGPFGIGL
jgi:hypothetical protein